MTTGGYTTKTGTSFATPTVSAFCALLVGAHPDLRPFEIKTILKAFSGINSRVMAERTQDKR
jgi:subtilase family protein